MVVTHGMEEKNEAATPTILFTTHQPNPLLLGTTTMPVIFILSLKAELENVESIKFKPDANVCVNVRNALSDYEVREKVVFNLAETLEQEEGAREPAHHFSLKWEGNKKASILTVLDAAAAKAALKKKKGTEVPRPYTGDDSGNFSPILAVECRGSIEPYAFFPMGEEFVVTSTSGKTFTENVDLSEGDWADYDEENDEPVSISDIKFKWEAV